MRSLLFPVSSLDDYLATGGRQGLERAVALGPAATIAEVAASGLRGRGGGGFPTGRKWETIAALPGPDRYIVVNGAEGEPGTFKDRALLRANPYQLVEGVIIAAFAIGATEAFICIKEAFTEEGDRLTEAITGMQGAGICTDCKVSIVRGPDAYLYGEEKAMLEVIEGRPPLPRVLPPHEQGLFTDASPTLVNNVETLSNVPYILAQGADWYRSMGTQESPGFVVCTVVGDVLTPGVAVVELGTALRDVIDVVGGGVAPGRTVKAVFSGVANPVVTADDLAVPVSYEGFRSIGSGMGACGFIVYDDTACMVEVARALSRFLSIESCGQCLPCKIGSQQVTDGLERVQAGVGTEADLDAIVGWLGRVTDGNRCYLAVEEQVMVASVLRRFTDEVTAHIQLERCPLPRTIEVPKLTDLRDGVASFDPDYHRKRPDWTYAPAS